MHSGYWIAYYDPARKNEPVQALFTSNHPDWRPRSAGAVNHMETVQLTIKDASYASALGDLLRRNGTREVRKVEAPDPNLEGVIVVDSEALDGLPLPLLNPERVVLITRNDAEHLATAWNAGVRSVVFNEDPLSTAVLAIMAAELRVPKADPCAGAGRSGMSGAAGCNQFSKAGTPPAGIDPAAGARRRDRRG
jgi:hypothetical protein